MITLTDLCEVMNNWFDTKTDGTKHRLFGTFTVKDGVIDIPEGEIKQGQYYRIIGSVFNDGVWQYPSEGLEDEEFDGAIWIMYVPRKVILLLGEINEWNDKYGPIVDSPFNSESFGGYSYYKGYRNRSSSTVYDWISKFTEKINRYRKARNVFGDKL